MFNALLVKSHKGASIKYVRRFFGFFDPSPLLYAFHATYQYYRTHIFQLFLPPLPPSVRTYIMDDDPKELVKQNSH